MEIADQGVKALSEYVDSVITIPNEKLLTILGKQASLLDAFGKANEVLQGAVQGIAELITRPGLINVDFADVRTVMSEMGMAMMGSAVASGEDRAQTAAMEAISSPLLENVDIHGARGILVNVTAGPDMMISEYEDVGNKVKELASEDATVVIGTAIDPEMGDNLRVTIVATGLGLETGRQQPYKVVKTGTGPVTYEELDTPTVIRHRRTDNNSTDSESMDYLDIPAFLRKQAD